MHFIPQSNSAVWVIKSNGMLLLLRTNLCDHIMNSLVLLHLVDVVLLQITKQRNCFSHCCILEFKLVFELFDAFFQILQNRVLFRPLIILLHISMHRLLLSVFIIYVKMVVPVVL